MTGGWWPVAGRLRTALQRDSRMRQSEPPVIRTVGAQDKERKLMTSVACTPYTLLNIIHKDYLQPLLFSI